MNFKLVILTLSLIFGIIFSLPSILNTKEGKKITLGLDLQGGLHMLIGVKTEIAVVNKIKSIASNMKNFTDKNDILIENFKIYKSELTFELLDEDELNKIMEHLKKIKGIETKFNKNNNLLSLFLTNEEIIKTKNNSVTQAIEVIRNRLNQYGLGEPLVSKQGKDNIVIEIPGIKTQEEEQRTRELISKRAKLDFMAVDESHMGQINSISLETAKGYGDLIIEDKYNLNRKYLVNEIPILSGDMLENANVGFDKNNRPLINFKLNSEGAEIFANFTSKNINKRLAIVLDNKVFSAPNIVTRIGGGSGQITGNYTITEAKDLSIILKSGSLIAPIYMLEKRSVGPSLGSDSIKSGFISLIVGFLLVLIFMISYYKIAGIIANIALIINLLLILAIMSLFGATLTLPGMAGIVLTVGMAVDSNVIISERIRELIKKGETLHTSIEKGYDKAMKAILDANITTLIAALLLYVYGTGSIKGFALTISIGIISSMITAIIGTKGIYDMYSNKINKTINHNLWFGIKG